MDSGSTSILLLDAVGQLKSILLPLFEEYKIKPTILDHISSYETLMGILDGNNMSVLLIDESFVGQLVPLGTKRLQQDFPDIEIMLFGENIQIDSGDTFRYFKKPVDPEVVMKNVILAARKNQIAQRKRRALQIFEKASFGILESQTEDDALRKIVLIASQIMDDTNRKGHFSHLAILTDGGFLTYCPQHHREDVFELLKAALHERIRDDFSKMDYPSIKLNNSNGERIGIVGIAVRERRTQRVDDVLKIPEYIPLHESVCSQIAVPIVYGSNDLYGVLNVEYPEKNAFDENDQAALEALTSLIAIAMNQMRLIEKERKHSSALKTLANMGRWVGEAARLDSEEIFRQAVAHADDLMGVKDEGYLSHLFLKEERKLTFSPVHHKGSVVQKVIKSLGGFVIDLDRLPVFDGKSRKGIVSRAIESGSIQCVGNVKEDPDYIPFSDDVNSQLAVPIKHDNQIIGAINIEHPRLNAFDVVDEENLNTLALYISIALKNGDLYAKLRNRAEQYEGVYRAGQMISRHNDLQLVLDEIAEQALQVVGNGDKGADLFSHVSLLEDQVYLRIKSINPKHLSSIYAERVEEVSKGFDLRGNQKRGISGRAFLEGKELNVYDVSEFQGDFISIVPGVKSQLSVPIPDLGVISIEVRHPHLFTEEDVAKIKLIASIGAVAIVNSRDVSEKVERVKQIDDLQNSYQRTTRIIILLIALTISLNVLWFLNQDTVIGNISWITSIISSALGILIGVRDLYLWVFQKRTREYAKRNSRLPG